MRVFKKFPLVYQLDKADCALACLRMICQYYNLDDHFDQNSYQYYTSKDGVSLDAVVEIAKLNYFKVVCGRISIDKLINEALLPCILHWDQNHFVVLYDIVCNNNKTKYKIADPDKGRIILFHDEFLKHWSYSDSDTNNVGIVILLEPGREARPNKKKKDTSTKYSFTPFFAKYKKLIFYIIIGTLIGGGIQLIFPFLTQSIVDIGIKNRDIKFITYILLGQLVLITGNMVNDFFRKWLVLKLGSMFSIQLLSDLVNKILVLPVRFFDSKHIGDLLQRFQDHDKVERFITTHFVNAIFAFVTLVILSLVLVIYNIKIFIIFILGSLLYITWTLMFLNKRKQLNNLLFSLRSNGQSKYHETIKGITEIKLQNYLNTSRTEMEAVQRNLYDANMKSLKLDQYLESGNIFINEFKNILITFFSAYFVINGEFTLGIMLSIQYIVGQLNVPINQFITFISGLQDAKLSLNRMNDVFVKKEENKGSIKLSLNSHDKIIIENLNFKYIYSDNEVLNNIDISIPQGQVTAIVGESGSGKTTLIKLLLKLYEPTSGKIKIGSTNLNDIDTFWWRDSCGTVLQDGYIFSDSIKKNIIMDNRYDEALLEQAAHISNINTFINELPFRFDTIIGDSGINLSHGQKQRILIARAVYKNPDYLFFDEATNSLDAISEKVIVNNLEKFLKHKTAFIVAHRLSTVRNADLIIVMNHGQIVEKGTHESLITSKGYYYELIKNQLELGL